MADIFPSTATSKNAENRNVQNASSDRVPPPAPMPSTIIENEQIYAAFENSIVQRVNQRLEEKLARRQTTYIGAVAIIVTLITAVGGYVGNLVLELQVDTKVREQLAREGAQILQEAEFLPRAATLEIQLRRMNTSESVNHMELERAVNDFELLYSRFVAPGLSEFAQKDEESDEISPDAIGLQVALTRERQLANSFDFIVQILSGLGRIEDFEQLGEVAPRLALDSTVALQSLSQSYGRQVISAAGAPESWAESNPYHETFLHYRDWSSRARQNNYPELFYVFEALVWFVEGRSSEDINELLRDIDGLNNEDGSAYEEILTDLALENFVRTPTAASGRIAERTRSFIAAFSQTSKRLARVGEAITKSGQQ